MTLKHGRQGKRKPREIKVHLPNPSQTRLSESVVQMEGTAIVNLSECKALEFGVGWAWTLIPGVLNLTSSPSPMQWAI